jgi:hypothetical protein
MDNPPDVKRLFPEFFACGTSSFARKKEGILKKKKISKCQKLEKKSENISKN